MDLEISVGANIGVDSVDSHTQDVHPGLDMSTTRDFDVGRLFLRVVTNCPSLLEVRLQFDVCRQPLFTAQTLQLVGAGILALSERCPQLRVLELSRERQGRDDCGPEQVSLEMEELMVSDEMLLDDLGMLSCLRELILAVPNSFTSAGVRRVLTSCRALEKLSLGSIDLDLSGALGVASSLCQLHLHCIDDFAETPWSHAAWRGICLGNPKLRELRCDQVVVGGLGRILSVEDADKLRDEFRHLNIRFGLSV